MMCFCNNSFDLCLMNFFLYYLSGSSQILYLKYVLQRYYNDTPKSFVGKDFYKQRWHGEKLLPMMKMKITFVSLCSCTKAAQYFQKYLLQFCSPFSKVFPSPICCRIFFAPLLYIANSPLSFVRILFSPIALFPLISTAE